jgi:hypothetical protein
MKPPMQRQWTYATYGLGLIALVSLVIGVMPSYSGQQSGKQTSEQSDQQAQSSQSQSRYQDDQGWQKVTGFIRKMRKFDVGNGEQQNLVVQIQTDKGRHQTIDLGNAEDLEDLDLRRGDRITAWGKPKTISGRQLLMAKKLKIDGEKIRIDRPEFSQASRQRTRQQEQDTARQGREDEGQSLKTIRGEVVGAGQVVAYDRRGNVMEIDRDAYYLIEEPDGRRAHLFVGEELDPWLNVGDSVEATVAPDGHVVNIASGAGMLDELSEMQSRHSGRDQGNRQEQFSRQPQSGQERSQDQLSRQQQSGQEREQTARQSQDERP